MNNLIHNFWNGEITLWKSYWIVGELLNALLILLIFKIYSAVTVNKVAVVEADKFQPALPPRMVATDTIFGFAIINSFYCYYPKIIAIAIAFPVEIPAADQDKAPAASDVKA